MTMPSTRKKTSNVSSLADALKVCFLNNKKFLIHSKFNSNYGYIYLNENFEAGRVPRQFKKTHNTDDGEEF